MPISREYFINLKGRDYVLFGGLMAEAHRRGLKAIRTEMQQMPRPENGMTAIVTAEVEFADGQVFHGIGDAGPETTKLTAYCRLAETRAIGRAFRFGLNISETMKEELGPDGPHDDADEKPSRTAVQPRQRASGPAGEGQVAKPLPHTLRREGPRHHRDRSQLDADAPCLTCSDYLTEIEVRACRDHGWPNRCFTCAKERAINNESAPVGEDGRQEAPGGALRDQELSSAAPGEGEGLVADAAPPPVLDRPQCSAKGCEKFLTQMQATTTRDKFKRLLCTEHAARVAAKIAASPAV